MKYSEIRLQQGEAHGGGISAQPYACKQASIASGPPAAGSLVLSRTYVVTRLDK
jgi:hypothetical protein